MRNNISNKIDAAAESSQGGLLEQVSRPSKSHASKPVSVNGLNASANENRTNGNQRENDVGKKVADILLSDLGEKVFGSWFSGLRVAEIKDNVAHVSLPTAFLRSWIIKNYADDVARAFRKAAPDVERLEFHLRDSVLQVEEKEQTPAGANANAAEEGALPAQPHVRDRGVHHSMSAGIAADLLFENFLSNSTNDFALAAAQQVVHKHPNAEYNPLVICGPIGVGKTHLLNAVGNALAGRASSGHLYISAVTFAQEFAAALNAKTTREFRARFDNVNLLLIDDIGFLAGKEAFASEFSEVINRFISSGRQVVATCGQSPARDEAGFDEKLRSRLSGGLIAPIDHADFELRRRFVIDRCKARRELGGRNVLADGVVDYVAQNVRGNLRELVGAVNRLLVTAQCYGSQLDVAVAADVLRDLVEAGNGKRRLSIEDIQTLVAEHFDISVTDLTSTRRTRSIARPRQIAMYLAKELTTRSYPEIGRMFGGKDHTTIIHACRRVEGLRKSDSTVNGDVQMLIERITQM